MKKSVWIFLFAVLLPSVVLGWLALRSAEEQQIVFERRTAELYQKETDSLAVTVRDTVDAERRVFGEAVHRLLAKGDAEALARDFTNTLADGWEVKAVGFVINRDGKLVSPSVATASKKPELQRFLLGNGGFLTSTEPAIIYNSAGDNNNPLRGSKSEYAKSKSLASQAINTASNASPNASATGKIAGKDAIQFNDGAEAANQVVIVGNQGTADGSATLNFGTQSNASVGLRAVEPIIAQAAVNAGTALSFKGQATIILNGGVQLNCQVPANVSAFDFTGVMSAPDQRDLAGNLNGIFPSGSMASSVAALAIAPQQLAEMQKKEGAVTFSAPLDQPAALNAPVPASEPGTLPATPLARAAGAAGKPAMNRKEMPVPALKSEGRDTPTSTADVKMKTRGAIEDNDASKLKPAAPIEGNDLAKKSFGTMDKLNSSSAAPGKTMATKRAGNEPERTSATLSPQAPEATRQLELKPADVMRDQQIQMAPSAPMPAKGRAGSFPAAKPQSAAPSPMPVAISKRSDASQSITNPESTLGDQAVITKTGSGALALNNAINRQVEPQQMLGQQSAALSTVVPETAEFRSLTEEGDDGLIARFAQDKLNLIFWVRPPEAPEMIFGCLVEAGHFSELWQDVLERHHTSSRGGRAALESKPEFVLALLDDRGKPVATQPAGAGVRDWRHPFVASEIGEVLPHWEAALYLASPTALAESARGLWRTLAFTIAGAVALIALGGWLVVADARRQLALAQQKTDFVSNVSHELKTPLTSIRMFAELMHDRPQPAEKQSQYLRIITAETERLTRLINNVLDFAKIGRKQKRFEKKPIDLHAIVARVWESQELHLREAGFATRWEAAPGPYPVLGDDDALAQVLVNLLSNAEKYSNGNKEVELHTWLDGDWVNISVLDRGMGVPNGDEKKIFEAFYRAHDSLASGIQGSGLGLTLAQRIVREHGGEIKLEHREGGGSRFTLRMPLERAV